MADPVKTSTPVLITFPPSLDSELSRFLVQHYGIAHVEQRHTMIFCFFSTLRHGNTFVFPMLYSDSYKLIGPQPISQYFDARCAPALQLWPQSGSDKTQAESDWQQFNNTLAWATADFAYYYLLPHRDIMIQPLSQGAPDYEQKAVERAYPVFAGLLNVLLRLSLQRTQASLDQIRTIFAAVDARLASGAKFLVGDRLTMSDLAFSVAAAPVLLPPEYGGPIPPFDQMPAEIQAVLKEMRAHPAGIFAMRIYAEHRNRFGEAHAPPAASTGQASAAGSA
ncbi:MAG: glutathione S-transferase C-terminal domain-containing protein [Candidatus Acidiferrales bacterium]